MIQVNMLEAKTRLSELGAALHSGEEDEIVIARNGVPYLSLKRYEAGPQPIVFGLAKGIWDIGPDFYDEFDALDDEIADMFEVFDEASD